MTEQQLIEELKQQVGVLAAQVKEFIAWKQARSRQQLIAPVDDASKAVLGVLTGGEQGSVALTQSVSISGTPTDIDVPAAYEGSIIISIGGAQYVVPYLTKV
jgi:hypothetical protein